MDARGNEAGLPSEVISIMYGRDDIPERYSYQPDSSFYVDGSFSIDLPTGKYQIEISKGVEYLDQSHAIDVRRGDKKELRYQLERWVNMPEKGWYSADDHSESAVPSTDIRQKEICLYASTQGGDPWACPICRRTAGESGHGRHPSICHAWRRA